MFRKVCMYIDYWPFFDRERYLSICVLFRSLVSDQDLVWIHKVIQIYCPDFQGPINDLVLGDSLQMSWVLNWYVSKRGAHCFPTKKMYCFMDLAWPPNFKTAWKWDFDYPPLRVSSNAGWSLWIYPCILGCLLEHSTGIEEFVSKLHVSWCFLHTIPNLLYLTWVSQCHQVPTPKWTIQWWKAMVWLIKKTGWIVQSPVLVHLDQKPLGLGRDLPFQLAHRTAHNSLWRDLSHGAAGGDG